MANRWGGRISNCEVQTDHYNLGQYVTKLDGGATNLPLYGVQSQSSKGGRICPCFKLPFNLRSEGKHLD